MIEISNFTATIAMITMYCSGFAMGFIIAIGVIFARSLRHYQRRKKRADEIISKLENMEKGDSNGKPNNFMIFPGVKE